MAHPHTDAYIQSVVVQLNALEEIDNMDPVTMAVLANAAIDLAARLVSEYRNSPDADPAELEKMNAKLDSTVEMVKSKRPIPRPTDG
jgi:hypothetical protein